MLTWKELKDTLHVEQLDTLLFRGTSISLGLTRVFGGQVLAQCLNAAYRSVDAGKVPHSLHGYFLRPGEFDKPIIFEVDPIRDGRSFATRRVVAIQNGEAIFNCSISFHRMEDGPSHQRPMPGDIPMPAKMKSDADYLDELERNQSKKLADKLRSWFLIFPKDVIDLRTPRMTDMLMPQDLPSQHGFWFKFKSKVTDPIMHQTLLAYISDKGLMGTGIRPHGSAFATKRMMGASLDHAMWFHGDVNVNNWNYYYLDSPHSGRARTFNRGSFYTTKGELIASTAQEGLFRLYDPKERK